LTAERSNGIAAIVLAAGASSRMGEQKLLLPLGGRAIVARVTERVAASRVDDVVIVLGRDADRLRAELHGTRGRFVENPRYRDGMGSSLRVGLDELDSRVRAALLVLADQPFVTTGMLDTLLQTYERRAPVAVISRFNGVLAPPHVFDRVLFPSLGLPGSEGAKAVLRAYGDRCEVIDFPPEGLIDVDDRESYRRALELAELEDHET
jgi:molybdenum cofactor cytidylyltransferase